MQFPFFNKPTTDNATGRRIKAKACGIGALLVTLGFVAGVGIHMLMGSRTTDRMTEALRLTDATDVELVTAVQNCAKDSGAYGSDEVRREMLWQMLRELMNRGTFGKAESVVDKVFPARVEDTPEWARRMLQIAHALVKNDRWDKAQEYYDVTQEAFHRLKLTEEYAGVVRERASLLSAGSGGTRAACMDALQKLLTGLTLQSTPELAAELHAFLAKLQSSMGARASAKEMLEKIAEDATLSPSSPTLMVCRGYAHFALHDDDAAVNCLRDGLKLLTGTDTASRMYRALALRDLASVALNLGRAQTALASLERAKSEVSSVLPPSALFRAEITGKRGWALYLAHDYEDALAVFKKQLSMIPDEEQGLRIYPLEGMTRCFLALGMPVEAQHAAQECCTLRERYDAEDKEGLGRSYLLHAQAQDQNGSPAEAEKWYGLAAATLPAVDRMRITALEGQASALSQTRRWMEALGVLEQLLNMLPEEDRIAREQIQEEMQHCRSQLDPQSSRTTSSPIKAGQKTISRPSKMTRKPATRTSAGKRRKR